VAVDADVQAVHDPLLRLEHLVEEVLAGDGRGEVHEAEGHGRAGRQQEVALPADGLGNRGEQAADEQRRGELERQGQQPEPQDQREVPAHHAHDADEEAHGRGDRNRREVRLPAARIEARRQPRQVLRADETLQARADDGPHVVEQESVVDAADPLQHRRSLVVWWSKGGLYSDPRRPSTARWDGPSRCAGLAAGLVRPSGDRPVATRWPAWGAGLVAGQVRRPGAPAWAPAGCAGRTWARRERQARCRADGEAQTRAPARRQSCRSPALHSQVGDGRENVGIYRPPAAAGRMSIVPVCAARS